MYDVLLYPVKPCYMVFCLCCDMKYYAIVYLGGVKQVYKIPSHHIHIYDLLCYLDFFIMLKIHKRIIPTMYVSFLYISIYIYIYGCALCVLGPPPPPIVSPPPPQIQGPEASRPGGSRCRRAAPRIVPRLARPRCTLGEA